MVVDAALQSARAKRDAERAAAAAARQVRMDQRADEPERAVTPEPSRPNATDSPGEQVSSGGSCKSPPSKRTMSDAPSQLE